MYFTNGDRRALESLMWGKPGNHITVQLVILIQLPELLRLGQRGRRLLTLNGHGDIPLIFGVDEGNLQRQGKGQLLFVHHLFQIGDKLDQPDIPLYLLVVHDVAIPDNQSGAFYGVLCILFGPCALMLGSLHLYFQRLRLFRRQDMFMVPQVILSWIYVNAVRYPHRLR